MLPEIHTLLSSVEYYLRITFGIIVHCWMLGSFRSYCVISWPTQSGSRLCIYPHVNVWYQYCHAKCPHKFSYNWWSSTQNIAAKTKPKLCNVLQFSTWRHVRLHYQAFWVYDALPTDMFIEISEDIAATILKLFSFDFPEDEGTKPHRNIGSYQLTRYHG